MNFGEKSNLLKLRAREDLKRKQNEPEIIKDIEVKKPKIESNLPDESIRETEHTNGNGILENDKPKVLQSPKKRLEIADKSGQKESKCKKEKFIYGNYSQYYGYRNKDFHDVRLDVFGTRKELFSNKDILDIGCNIGFITTAMAKQFNVKTIVGIDIDRTLINQAIKNLIKAKKKLPMDNSARKENKFPYNVHFVHGNYVLKDDVLLEIEQPQFDVILCLSITKWIQLNFGDNGLRQAFRRMFLQLRKGGFLILEAQPIKNYKKRKNLSEAARKNFENLKFPPEIFTEYLLSKDVGFNKMELLGVPEHCVNGFKRPIQVFYKE